MTVEWQFQSFKIQLLFKFDVTQDDASECFLDYFQSNFKSSTTVVGGEGWIEK
jgi:hypothetical protein